MSTDFFLRTAWSWSSAAVEADLPARLLHTCLRLSPSYAVAHSVATGQQSSQAEPLDLSIVSAIYGRLGDVNVPFEQWRGREALLAKTPPIRLLTILGEGESGTTALQEGLDEYTSNRQEDGFPPAAVLAIPLGHSVSELTVEVQRALTNLAGFGAPTTSDFALRREGLALATVQTRLRACLVHAFAPDMPGWKIAALVRPELSQSQKFSVDIQKRRYSRTNKRSDEDVGRTNLKTVANRDIRAAELLVENAARGRFPSVKPFAEFAGKFTEHTYAEVGRRLRQLAVRESHQGAVKLPPMWSELRDAIRSQPPKDAREQLAPALKAPCLYCKGHFSLAELTRWHDEKCKLKPLRD